MTRESLRLIPVGPEFNLGPNISDRGAVKIWPVTKGDMERVQDPALYPGPDFGEGLALVRVALHDQGMVTISVTGHDDGCFNRWISHGSVDEGMARYEHLVRWQSALAFIDHDACTLMGLEP